MSYDDRLYFNGIDAATGEYLQAPCRPEELARSLTGGAEPDPDPPSPELLERARHKARGDRVRGVATGIDPCELAEAGWGVVLPAVEPGSSRARRQQEILAALQPLLEHRRAQATRHDERLFQVFDGARGLRPAESKRQFLGRHGAGAGPVDPLKVPYYLLLVGDPEEIPFSLQHQLDVPHAVGRLCFDSPEGYAAYAHTVVRAETSPVPPSRRRELAMLAVTHPGDPATALSRRALVDPLAERLASAAPDWTVRRYVDEHATKADLARLLGGDATPAVLFTASHGMGFPMGDSRQLAHQGALLCQDWDKKPGRVSESSYFAGDDVSASAKLAGLIAFFFACYGGGTPQLDAFFHRAGKASAIAPRPFFAQLPTRLLGHPQGGALAVVGHIERAWGCSFFDAKSGYQTAVFESFLYELLSGKRIGNAMERFGQRYGELSAGLVDKLEDLKYGSKEVSETEVANDWTENNDARNYLLLGDPAVRVPVVDDAEVAPRPTIEARSTPVTQSSSGVAQAPPEGAGDGVSYGWFSRDKDEGAEAVAAEEGAPPEAAASGGALDSLRGFVAKLGERISSALDDMAHLEIKTYVTSEMDRIQVRGDDVEGAQLRAYTRIALDGDMVVCLPERDGEIDRAILEIHQRMVQQAQTTRTELMKTIVQAAASLMGPTK